MKIVLNTKNVGAYLKSQSVLDMLNARAAAVMSGLTEGYAVSQYVGKTRPNVMIYAESVAARLENLRDNTILKAVSGK